MDFRGFETGLLRLAFTSSVDLSPASLAFYLGLPVAQSRKYMQRMVTDGLLELDSDEEGHLKYLMPDRPQEPVFVDEPAFAYAEPAPVLTQELEDSGRAWPSAWECTAIALREPTLPAFPAPEPVSGGRATAALFLNALVCPGMGSMVGGRNAVGIAQMSLFMVGLPLAVVNIGVPLLAASWIWGILTGARLVGEAQD